MLTIQNLNSSITPKEDDIVFAANRASFFSHLTSSIPVYLVDPKLMDRIYPPERRRFLFPRCAKEFIDTFERKNMENEEVNLDILMKELERCREIVRTFTAIGVYTPSTYRIQETIEEETGQEIPLSKAIFICPERIDSLASEFHQKFSIEKETSFRTLFAKIFIHEFAHAYMDEGEDLDQAWERVIEESLANAFALKYLHPYMGEREKFVFEQFASTQPVEYRGYRIFTTDVYTDSNFSLEYFAKAWAERKPPFITLPVAINCIDLIFLTFPAHGKVRYPHLHPKMSSIYPTRRIRKIINELYEIYACDICLSYYKLIALNVLKIFS